MAVSLATTAAPPATTTLAARIDAHIGTPRFAAADWGIAVVSLDDGRTLYAHRADHLMQPASTTKLFTAALALSTLGADYRMPTRLLAGGAIANGRLDGPLILYGMGDPTLGTVNTSADWADQLAGQLAARGVRRVHGNVIADDSYFRGPLTGSGWEAGDLQSAFAAPASALSVRTACQCRGSRSRRAQRPYRSGPVARHARRPSAIRRRCVVRSPRRPPAPR